MFALPLVSSRRGSPLASSGHGPVGPCTVPSSGSPQARRSSPRHPWFQPPPVLRSVRLLPAAQRLSCQTEKGADARAPRIPLCPSHRPSPSPNESSIGKRQTRRASALPSQTRVLASPIIPEISGSVRQNPPAKVSTLWTTDPTITPLMRAPPQNTRIGVDIGVDTNPETVATCRFAFDLTITRSRSKCCAGERHRSWFRFMRLAGRKRQCGAFISKGAVLRSR